MITWVKTRRFSGLIIPFNPWRGCTKVSPGCAHCYAETQSKRNPKVLGIWGKEGSRSIASEAYWKQPFQWDRAAAESGERRRVFCASLADVFEGRDTMPMEPWAAVEEARARLFRTIDSTPNLDWLLLTKRPENIGDMWHTSSEYLGGERWGKCMPTRRRFRRKNVWLGTSVEDQELTDERVPELLKCRDLAQVLFLAVEPLLGPVDLTRIRRQLGVQSFETYSVLRGKDGLNEGQPRERIDWVIVGGESGSRARPLYTQWVRDLVRQCSEAGAACFVKQLGAAPRGTSLGPFEQLRLMDKKGGDPEEWPAGLRVRQFPDVAH